jgi:hypothetical protein
VPPPRRPSEYPDDGNDGARVEASDGDEVGDDAGERPGQVGSSRLGVAKLARRRALEAHSEGGGTEEAHLLPPVWSGPNCDPPNGVDDEQSRFNGEEEGEMSGPELAYVAAWPGDGRACCDSDSEADQGGGAVPAERGVSVHRSQAAKDRVAGHNAGKDAAEAEETR